MTAGRGLPKSPVAATTMTSPRLMSDLVTGRIELGDRFNPAQRLVLLVPNKLSNLSGHPPADRPRPWVGNHEPQFTQTLLAPSLSHHSHSFCRFSHLNLDRQL